MKFILLALAVFSAGVSAVPKGPESRFIDGIITGVIQDLINNIRERGLDPLTVEKNNYRYTLPVTDLLLAEAVVEDFLMEGISNIVINRIDFSILATRLRFDISLPGVGARIGSASGKVRLGNWNVNGDASGILSIENIRVTGEVRVSIGISSGISISSVRVNLSVGDIKSNLNLVLLNRDVSNIVNGVLGETIPGFLTEFENDINTLLAHIILEVAGNLLN